MARVASISKAHIGTLRATLSALATLCTSLWAWRRLVARRGSADDPSSLSQFGVEVGPHGWLYATARPRHLSSEPLPPPSRVSFLHDIPLRMAAGRFSFVCEVPRGATAKLEVAAGEDAPPHNPLRQDVDSRGVLRHYPWRALVNYGMLPQTLSDEGAIDVATGRVGDSDPIDAMDLWPVSCLPGEAYAVRVLGALAMVDGGASDWKVLVLRDNGAIPPVLLDDVSDLVRQLEALDEELSPDGVAGFSHSVVSLQTVSATPPSTFVAVPVKEQPLAFHSDALAVSLSKNMPTPAFAAVLTACLSRTTLTGAPSAPVDPWEALLFAPPVRGQWPWHLPSSPPALLQALERLSSGAALSADEGAMLRQSTRVWAARLMVHLREWLRGYKSAAAAAIGGSAPLATFEWDGAFVTRRDAFGVIDRAHEAWGRRRK